MSLIDEIEKITRKLKALENEIYITQFELFKVQKDIEKLKKKNYPEDDKIKW